jgi:drug/metabolite transporter (DMT)-like permease
MIGIAIGPAVIITAIFYYLRCPRTDFAVLFAALWLISDIAIEFISPKPLPNFLIVLGFVPALLIGIFLHWRRFQRRHERVAWPSARRG